MGGVEWTRERAGYLVVGVGVGALVDGFAVARPVIRRMPGQLGR